MNHTQFKSLIQSELERLKLLSIAPVSLNGKYAYAQSFQNGTLTYKQKEKTRNLFLKLLTLL